MKTIIGIGGLNILVKCCPSTLKDQMGFFTLLVLCFSLLLIFYIWNLKILENTGSFTSEVLQSCDNFTVLASLHWFSPLLAFIILMSSKSADTEPIHGQNCYFYFYEWYNVLICLA